MVFRRDHLPLLGPFLCVLGAFGPYLGTTGVRLEQVVIYVCALALVIFKPAKLTLSRSAFAILVAWAVILLLGIVNTYFAVADHVRVVPAATMFQIGTAEEMSWKNLFGGIDNLVLPMASCLVAVLALRGLSASQQQTAAFRLAAVITGALAINTIFSGIVILAPDRAFPVIRLFWPPGDASVGFASFSQQRICGVFNQPGEAGTAYSLGLLLWAYRLRNREGHSWIEGCILVLLFTGGIFSASKIFFFVGIPLALIYAARCFSPRKAGRVRFHAYKVGAVSGALAVLALAGAIALAPSSMFQFQQVQAFFADLQNSSILEVLTGGRFGGSSSEQSVVTYYAQVIFTRSPVFGLGFGSLAAYDSAYIQMFAFGGLVALSAYLIALAAIGWHFIAHRKNGLLGTLVCLVMLAGGLGMPMLTLNRTGTLLVLTLTFLWILAKSKAEAATHNGQSIGPSQIS